MIAVELAVLMMIAVELAVLNQESWEYTCSDDYSMHPITILIIKAACPMTIPSSKHAPHHVPHHHPYHQSMCPITSPIIIFLRTDFMV